MSEFKFDPLKNVGYTIMPCSKARILMSKHVNPNQFIRQKELKMNNIAFNSSNHFHNSTLLWSIFENPEKGVVLEHGEGYKLEDPGTIIGTYHYSKYDVLIFNEIETLHFVRVDQYTGSITHERKYCPEGNFELNFMGSYIRISVASIEDDHQIEVFRFNIEDCKIEFEGFK